MAPPAPTEHGRIPSTSHTASQTNALWILATLSVLWFLRQAADLLIPIVLALLLSLALAPVVTWLVRYRLPRVAAAALVLGVLLSGLGWGAYAMKDNLLGGLRALPEAAQRARDMIDQVFDGEGGAEVAPAGRRTTSSSPPDATDVPAQVISGAASMAQEAGQSVLSLAGNAVVVVFLIFFLLYAGPDSGQRIVALAGNDDRRRVVATILQDVNAQIQRFLFVRLITSIVVALATWAVLAWMDTANALMWGLLAGVFNSIPYFGPVIVSGGLFVVGIVQGGGAAEALRMSAAALVITSIEGWLLTPPLLGRAERMNVLSVFLGLLLFTWLWGAWGTLLAVPMLAIVKSVADRVEGLHPLGRIMAP